MLAGLFIGGRATRMGSIHKGLLQIDGEPIVVRLARMAREAGLEPVWVGLRDDAYRRALPGLREIADAVPGIGPPGGLLGLLAEGSAIALACDMPFVSAALLVRLRDEHPSERVLAPRFDGFWEPLCARYDASVRVDLARAIAAGTRSLQPFLSALPARELTLASRDELRDWDAPGDISTT
ncbi:MAG TPA: NTP transferase domain-containing protein [Polyangiales bacterium]|nr:NTP transferase domain-containing protein [Polyangiales bacterium]